MKYVKDYKYFLNRRPIQEEFISKLFRNISGKNKERIEEIKNLCNEISSIYFDVVETGDFGDINKELKEKEFINVWSLLIDKNDIVGSEDGLNFIKNIISILKVGKDDMSVSAGNRLNTELDFIKSLDENQYLQFKDSLNKLVGKAQNEKETVVRYAFIKNLEKIVEQKSKALTEANRIFHILKSKELFYYYNPINLKLDSGTWYKAHVGRFVKSLVLKLTKNKEGEETKVCDRNIDGYAEYAINSIYNWSYDDEYGIDYFDKKIGKETLDKKVSELENYKKLIAEIEEIKPILKEFYDKLDHLGQSIKKLQSTPPKFFNEYYLKKYLKSGFSTGDLTQPEESKLKNLLENLKNELKSYYVFLSEPRILLPDFYYSNYEEIFWLKEDGKTVHLNPIILIELIDEFKKSYESKKVKEVLIETDEKFSSVDLLEVTESDSPNTWWKDEKKLCGNILYHGSIHYRLDQPGEIEKLIYKRSPYQQRYAGKGVYCTVYPSAACQYQYLRGTTGGMMNQLPDSIRNQFLIPNSDYFPCIYKFTLKPGSKFEFKSDTTMDDDEFENLKKIGIQGIHSGWNNVIGGETQETCIIDPETIIKVEKLKPSEILNIDDDLWKRGSNFEKETFIKWYKDLIAKRKDSQI